MIEQPENPGIYLDVPNADYRSWPAASNSDLSVISELSPSHMRWRRANPSPCTPALAFGRAVHTALLEPDRFDQRYLIAKQCETTTGKGSRCMNMGIVTDVEGAWYCGLHGRGLVAGTEQAILSALDFEAIQRIVESVRRNEAAFNLLNESDSLNEVSAIFRHPSGLICKLRADGLRPTWESIIDLKTCQNASRAVFERSIAQYGYHRQAAFYIDGMQSLGHRIQHFAFICIEKEPPYGVAVYRLMNDALDAGREELDRLVKIFAQCAEREKELGESAWYGYEGTFLDISLPSWKMRQLFNAAQ